MRILSCMGIRAAESPARRKREPFSHDRRATNSKRTVDVWLPIHHWSAAQVWAEIQSSGVESHPAYALGMPRLSCVFCVFASEAALMVAGKHNPELLAEYVEVEREVRSSFKRDLRLAEIQGRLLAGEEPPEVATWEDAA